MFGFIKRWMERCRRKAILKDIKEAKYIYLCGQTPFMCHCFMKVDYDKYGCDEKIREIIPEFKPETFNVRLAKGYHVWWHPSDRKSRMKAFDKLIEIYSD
jgi:hypothetical protein